jgi:Molybdopterin-binding domain of aldehyde dehydrogenase
VREHVVGSRQERGGYGVDGFLATDRGSAAGGTVLGDSWPFAGAGPGTLDHNPDGIRNQIEGGILQSSSWTLYEGVSFDETGITSSDWSSFSILRFPDVPKSIDVHVIEGPSKPFLGTGEAAQGPMAAAISNAVADAIGVRIREPAADPTRDRIKAATGV